MNNPRLQPLGSSRRNSLYENNVKLLLGEVLIAKAQNVLMFAPVGDLTQGISGVLSVTNFKLSFLTTDDTNSEVSPDPPHLTFFTPPVRIDRDAD